MDAEALKAILESVQKGQEKVLEKIQASQDKSMDKLIDRFEKVQESDREKREKERQSRKEWQEAETKRREKEEAASKAKIEALEQQLSQQKPLPQLVRHGTEAGQGVLPPIPHLKTPMQLRDDASLLEFNCWHQSWIDYSTLIGIKSYPNEDQLRILRMLLLVCSVGATCP